MFKKLSLISPSRVIRWLLSIRKGEEEEDVNESIEGGKWDERSKEIIMGGGEAEFLTLKQKSRIL